MPSALETLVKILKLEREQGCKNSAVIGGLGAYGEKWALEAHNQARRPEHHALVNELAKLLGEYETFPNKTERTKSIAYMLDRIMGRVPPPPEYQVESTPMPMPVEAPPVADAAPQPPAPPPEAKPRVEERPPRQEQPRREKPQRRPPSNRAARPAADDDEDDDTGEMEDRRDGGSYDNYEQPVRRAGGRPTVVERDLPPQPRLARPPRRPRPTFSPEEAADITRGLEQPVTVVKGVGPGMAKLLERLDIHSVNDLLEFYPRRYDDYTRLRNISQLQPDMVATVIGTVVHVELKVGKGSRKDFFMVIDDGSARMSVMFFGQHYLIRQIKVGQQLVLSGTTSYYSSRIQMTNPEWEQLDTEHLHTIGIVPVYRLTEGLSARALRKLMKKTVTYWADRLPDYVPEATLERADLGDLGWAIKNTHFPEGWDHLHHARRRLEFDQLLLLQLALLGNRRDWQSVPGQPLHVSDEFLESFISAVFPYPLTGAQRRSIDDIRRDVTQNLPMNRLLQGDVGSGKTAVATVAMAMAFANGKQAALMAPTGILAEQHYRGISAMLANTPGDRKPVVALLTSAISNSERESIYRGISDGSIDVVIGTHALIQEGVEFKDLAIAIVDEQHRFGVEQRKALRGKGTNPHLLVMTATPIPRTLALTMFADLDLSIIDEMPPGRIPIQTRVVTPGARERLYNFVEAELNKGRQAFIVHPLVEASEKIEAPAAVDAYEQLQQVFYRHKVGLLHGRMKPTEKDEVMAAFAEGKYHVLVTTSVAEVGVNVPNATVMVIESADRFGLAQLHQFRGRVGRGEHASYCLLVSEMSLSEQEQRDLESIQKTGDFSRLAEMARQNPKIRLIAMQMTNDGFKLAQMDWELRGAGDLIGTRQSGINQMQLAAEITPQLVELAQREARTIYAEDPDLSQPQHHLLAQRVTMLHNERGDVS